MDQSWIKSKPAAYLNYDVYSAVYQEDHRSLRCSKCSNPPLYSQSPPASPDFTKVEFEHFQAETSTMDPCVDGIMRTRLINLAITRAHIASSSHDDPTAAWEYNMGYGEVATPFPKPVAGAMTTFFNLPFSIRNEVEIVRAPRRAGWALVENNDPDEDSAEWHSPSLGNLVLSNAPGVDGNHIYSSEVKVWKTNNAAGSQAIRSIMSSLNVTNVSYVPHGEWNSSLSFPEQHHGATHIFNRLRLRRVTGYNKSKPSDDWHGLDDKLGTVFEIIDPEVGAFTFPNGSKYPEDKLVDKNVIVRALVGYFDGTVSSSVGPTIEYISVRRDYHGKGLALVMFDEIEKWFLENWALKTKTGKLMMKVTQLRGTVADYLPSSPSDEARKKITDKKLFFETVGFSANVHECGGYLGFMSKGRPRDEEACRYYDPANSKLKLPTSAAGNIVGKYACETCGCLGSSLKVCSKCKEVRYCNHLCQRQDWAQHKLYCGLNVDEVRKQFNLPDLSKF